MNRILDDVKTLARETEGLMDSAASAVGERYGEARQGLSSVLEQGRDFYGIARRKAVENTRAADAVIHDNIYRTVLVGAGVGMILGYFLARRRISSGG